MAKQAEKMLWSVTESDYGADYKAHLLEQYQLFVQSAENVSQRRTAANNYLLTVNAFLVTFSGLALSYGIRWFWIVLVSLAGLLVCITWLGLIQSYRNLNTAKFKVIHEFEQRLPTAPFDREWELAERGEGRAYRPLTHIEPYIPLIFGALYIVLAVSALIL